MKTFKIILLSTLFVLTANAKDKVVLHSLGSLGTIHPHVIPTVTSENDDVTISSDSTIYNVDIIIKDQYGQVLHQSTQTIDPTGTVVSVPNYGSDSEKTTIDLYYDRQHLCGYFEN